MKILNLVFLILPVLFPTGLKAVGVIRINQLGYLPNSIKVAVFLSEQETGYTHFSVHNAISGSVVFENEVKEKDASGWGMKKALRLDFSLLTKSGGYFIKVGNTKSPNFRIGADVYEGTADFLLNYLRQQRCGYNPFLKDSCHVHDGIIVDHPEKTGQVTDVTGGWHDATDYLQYSTTSINTVFQMMFAWQNYPEIYKDFFDENGNPGGNKRKDILDEIKWGLDWMLKMNPAPGEMYNQIADDRDHVGFRLPSADSADYGLGKYRPVYFVTGKPQGLSTFKNQSTGVSSIAGKFASGFALGAKLFEKEDPGFAAILKKKANEAWNFALTDTGFCQTACNVSPYFYEERNFTDDLELAAVQLYDLYHESVYLEEAIFWGRQEIVSPWIKNGTSRHYESYPFINLAHFFLAKNNQKDFTDYYRIGLQMLKDRGENDPFYFGLPFIWCSNNLVVAALTQAKLYFEISGDNSFLEMESALRDWLFGCNPWGTAMVCGLPKTNDSPEFPHSSYTVVLGKNTPGGLVDGPVSDSIYKNLIGIKLLREDEYARFNRGKAVYHDDIGDYSTNEPTMDGTASLSFYLASLEWEGKKQSTPGFKPEKDRFGAVVRINPDEKVIYLAFTADSAFDGGRHVMDVLKKHEIKGSFFFTGNFLRDCNNKDAIETIVAENHFVGAHSNRHLLYCSWQFRDSLLIDQQNFESDLSSNFTELGKFGIKPEDASFFMPPYEWYNDKIVEWSHHLGLNVINFTPGTGTNADYTSPEMKNYKTSDQLLNDLKHAEENCWNGRNGAILLVHPGTDTKRTDKFYFKLETLILFFQSKGYQFKSLKHWNG